MKVAEGREAERMADNPGKVRQWPRGLKKRVMALMKNPVLPGLMIDVPEG
jgi:hypothetical protein